MAGLALSAWATALVLGIQLEYLTLSTRSQYRVTPDLRCLCRGEYSRRCFGYTYYGMPHTLTTVNFRLHRLKQSKQYSH